jgi:hypothetical protein
METKELKDSVLRYSWVNRADFKGITFSILPRFGGGRWIEGDAYRHNIHVLGEFRIVVRTPTGKPETLVRTGFRLGNGLDSDLVGRAHDLALEGLAEVAQALWAETTKR